MGAASIGTLSPPCRSWTRTFADKLAQLLPELRTWGSLASGGGWRLSRMVQAVRLGDFEVQSVVRRDASGAWCRGAHVVDGTPVEIKQYLPFGALSTAQLTTAHEEFVVQVAAYRRAALPEALPVLASGRCGDGAWVATGLPHGASLAERLDELGALSRKEALQTTRALAAILDGLHRARVVHRNVCASCVVLAPDGLRVRDAFLLGRSAPALLALAEGALSVPREALDFVSPEQARGLRQTSASNRYAFALLAYLLLVGERAFASTDPVERLYLAAYGNPRPPSDVGGARFRALDPIFVRALNKQPEKRYASCSELAEAVEAALARRLIVVPEALLKPSDDGSAAGEIVEGHPGESESEDL